MGAGHLLKIGASGFAMAPRVATEAIAVMGRRRSGKTNTATVIVEELLKAGVQVIIVEPKDEWWGLTSGRDGKAGGFPLTVMGGWHADLPIGEIDGGTIADFVVQHGNSCVISTARFDSDAASRRFVTEFATRLFRQKSEPQHRTPMMVVFEEASRFVPQSVTGETAKMVGAVQKLVRMGGALGLGVMLIDQRPASVNKDVLTQAGVLVVHQVSGPQDRKALQTWIDAHGTVEQRDEFERSLASLQQGQGWFWSGDLDLFEKVQVRSRMTFDSSRTPEIGDKAVGRVARAAVDLDALKGKLAATIERARADDPRELKKKIAELEQQIRNTSSQKPDERSIKSAVDAAIEHERRIANKRMVDRDADWELVLGGYKRRLESIPAIVGDAFSRVTKIVEQNGLQPPQRDSFCDEGRNSPAAQPAANHHAARVAPRRVEGDSNLSTLEDSLLTVLARHPAGLTKTAACMYAGYKPSGDVSTAWSRFAQSEWITRTADGVRITDAGLAALGDYEPLPTGQALREMWIAKSSPLEAALLTQLFARHPHGGSKTEICEAAGYRPSGDVSTAWSKFNTLGWIQRTANGVRAADMWFD